MTVLTNSSWEKLLLRWTNMQPTGEVRLVCAMLAAAIVADVTKATDEGRKPCGAGFCGSWRMDAWCGAIGLRGAFVREQVCRAHMHELADI